MNSILDNRNNNNYYDDDDDNDSIFGYSINSIYIYIYAALHCMYIKRLYESFNGNYCYSFVFGNTFIFYYGNHMKPKTTITATTNRGAHGSFFGFITSFFGPFLRIRIVHTHIVRYVYQIR